MEIGKRAFELVPIFLSKLLGHANGRSYFYLFLLENIHSKVGYILTHTVIPGVIYYLLAPQKMKLISKLR